MATGKLSDRVFDLETIEVLDAVARAGSMSKAAAELGVSQQAISARLRSAETALGRPLLLRSTSGSRLSETGLLVVSLAEPILVASQRLEASVEALRRESGGLSLAASQTIAELLLPEWLIAFRGAEPHASVRLSAGNSESVTDMVRQGTVDLGFVEGPSAPSNLGSRVVATDHLVLVVAPGHSWAGLTTPLPPQILAETPLLAREEGSGTRASVESWFGSLGLALSEPAAVLDTTAIVRANARAGVAPAIMSLNTISEDLNTGRLVEVPLQVDPPPRRLRAIWQASLSTKAERFLALIEAPKTQP